jgi:purine-nucleoside phosphorylase
MLLKHKVRESINFLASSLGVSPKVGIILGSGLGDYTKMIKDPLVIPTAEIPHYPRCTVPGHEGRWVAGRVSRTPVLAIQGRLHYYEGYTLILVVTAACGAINPEYKAHDLMLITDHINFAFKDPLIGDSKNQLGPRFPHLGGAYDRDLLLLAQKAAQKTKIPIREGIFCWVTGPSFETAAEIRMMRALGGDVVSMSTVPEVIVACQRHLRVLGIAHITNLATGLAPVPLTHEDVMRSSDAVLPTFINLMREIIIQLHKSRQPGGVRP